MKSDRNETWTHRTILLDSARVGELVVTTIFVVAVAGFYAAHLAWSTGFFTSAFAPITAVFFISIFWTIVSAGSKAVISRKDILALVEWIGAALFVGVAAWLYTVFPFNFSHLADVVPTQLQFLFSWITNDIGHVLVALILIAGIIALIVDSVKLAWRISTRVVWSTTRVRRD